MDEKAFQSGVELHRAGRLAEAERIYRQILAQEAENGDALHMLRVLAVQAGQLDSAVELIRRAIAVCSTNAFYYSNLGKALEDLGQLDEAIAACRQAIRLKPDYADAHYNLAIALERKRLPAEAIAACSQAIRYRPDHADAHYTMGNVFRANRQPQEAIAAYRRATALRPDYVDAHNNLGMALRDSGRYEQAITSYQRAIQLKPDFAKAFNNLGNALNDLGRGDEAIAAYRQATWLKPDYAKAHSNLIFTMNYHPDYDARMIHEEHRLWNERHAEGSRKFIPSHGNNRDPDRRLRVGYVSADFWNHPVGRFVLPLLEHHDHRQFEIFCYSAVTRPDAVTARFPPLADHWREIVGTTDEQAATQILADRIDILVDLAGHTAGNRLLVFARKPAPVQISYLGYPCSTGLSAINYRLTDGFANPPNLADDFHTESLYRLPETNWCFAAPPDSPPVEPPPSNRLGYMTFGSFNKFAKVTDPMLRLWGRILQEAPGSRLLLKAAAFDAESAGGRVRRNFAEQGIDVNRLDLRSRHLNDAAHLGMYGEMDIALDTFPYHGTATTCEAMWMGVPVVTLAGRSHASRVGRSLLSNIQLPELVAATPEQYIHLAVTLANDRDRLNTMRRTLRSRMQASPLMDAPRFARNIEAAYRQMWRNWCEQAANSRLQSPAT
jgi:protein O-GlcNAc transferase